MKELMFSCFMKNNKHKILRVHTKTASTVSDSAQNS